MADHCNIGTDGVAASGGVALHDRLDEHVPPVAGGDAAATTRTVLRLYHCAAAGLDGVLVLTVINPKTGAVHPQQFAIAKIDEMADEAVARGGIANVYFAPAVLKKSLPVTARGTSEDIVAVLGLIIDDDADTCNRAVLPPGILPSFEVTTCAVPCVNRHLHFVFIRPIPPKKAQQLAELLYRKCGGDSGTGDIDHVWRLPGTLNFPNKVKVAKRGRPVDPQRVILTGGSMQPVDPEELRRALEAMPDLLKPRSKGGNGDGRSYRGGSTDRAEILARLPGEIIDLVETEIVEGEGDRSAHSFRTMLALMEHGLTNDEIALVAKGAWFALKFTVRGDIDAEISRVRTKWEEQHHESVRGAQNEQVNNTAPDMSIIRRNRTAAPEFPINVLGSAADWVGKTAAIKNAPVEYVGMSLFGTAAGMIGPKRRAQAWEGWEEPSILWIILHRRPQSAEEPQP